MKMSFLLKRGSIDIIKENLSSFRDDEVILDKDNYKLYKVFDHKLIPLGNEELSKAYLENRLAIYCKALVIKDKKVSNIIFKFPSFSKSEVRKDFTLPEYNVVFDEEEERFYIGDGETLGGRLFDESEVEQYSEFKNLYSEKILSLPLQARAMLWLYSGERGISSETIFYALMGIGNYPELSCKYQYSKSRSFDIPHDPSDFRRCYLLLRLIPEWRDRLYEVALLFPKWKNLVDNWDELTAIFERDPEYSQELFSRISELEKEYYENRS